MGTKLISALAAITLVGGLFAVPSASAAPAPDGETTVEYIVPTRHGDLYLQVVHPTKGGKILPAPMVLTLSPYNVLGLLGQDSGDWVPRGYARGYADVLGTRNSGGCFDYGGTREKESGYDLVEWIAKQKWSNGKIGMIGGSYDGTTANATAVMRPPHLTTIVPEAAINHWYGYAYSGGIRFFLNNAAVGHQGPGAATDEGIDTPAAFDFGLALIPPPTDATGANWAQRVQSSMTPCDEITHTEHGYDDTPDYDKFWVERDYLKDAAKVTIPVLVAANWGDWNVKQEESWDWFHALKNSEKAVLYMGTAWEGHGTPGDADYDKTVNAWMDHYLMGKDNGIEKMPSVITQTSDLEGAGKYFKGAPKVRNVVLYAQQTIKTTAEDYGWNLMTSKPREFYSAGPAPDPSSSTAAFPSTNINTESHALHHGGSNHDWWWFESLVFKKDVRIFGAPKVQVYNTVGREWVTVTPTLADVDPAAHVMANGSHVATDNPNMLTGVTRGWLDSRYRNGLDKQVLLEPGKPWLADITLNPTDYTFLAGHYVGLTIQTEINEWSIPKPYPGCDVLPNPNNPTGATKEKSCATFFINWEEAKTRLILPIVDAPKNIDSLFHPLGHQH
jgi:X-Pro dipeptidyl-peptidase